MNLTRFDFDSLPVTPWRNGGGETREIACWPSGAQDFDWRASIATIAQDGPFSAFSGIDRSITLLEGDGVHLFSAGQIDHHLSQVGEPFAFSGDVALHATLLGGSSQDFNIMTRRGRRAANVQRITAATTLPEPHAGVLYVLQGRWRLADGITLGARQGAWWSAGEFSGRLTPLAEDSVILWADITPG
ncbi:HutD/Ves family protein [Serratia quinivorans]|uniref:HutD/Ves family protein n=1 Tax=Serratia quinivorans TaxID=137545 RepID=UPI003F99E80B